MAEEREAKGLLRQEMRALGRGLAPERAAHLSAIVCTRVGSLGLFAEARHVAVYAPLRDEIDSRGLVAVARATGKRTYYPRLEGRELRFVLAEPETLRPGRLGILEPADGPPLPRGGDGALFVVPGVAFDLRGTRLGRGSGHYDGALKGYPGVPRIGVAYEFQVVPALPTAPWDVPVDAVVTDARVIGHGDR